MRNIGVLALGGTFFCKQTPQGLSPGYTLEDLCARFPEMRAYPYEQLKLPSGLLDSNACVTMGYIAELFSCIRDAYDAFDGLLLISGTDRMCRIAARLAFFIRNNRKPLIMTGAMYPPDDNRSDVVSNYVQGMQMLQQTNITGGTYIAFADKVIPMVDAMKIDADNREAFVPHSYTAKDLLQYATTERQGPPIFDFAFDENIGVLTPDASAADIDHMLVNRAALILHCAGTDGITPAQNGAICHWLDRGKIVVVKSENARGATSIGTYAVSTAMHEREVLSAVGMPNDTVYAKIGYLLAKTKGDLPAFRSGWNQNVVGELGPNLFQG